jgi:ferredoxin
MTATVATFTCTVVGPGGDDEEFAVREGRTVLDAMPKCPGAPIQVGCRGGGCGVCRVQVLDGEYTTQRMSRRFVTKADEANGRALACRLVPDGDLTIRRDPLRPGR